MDPDTYQRWWALHLRVARGETLSAEERPFYEAGLKQLQQEETLKDPSDSIRELRAGIAALQAEHAQLHAQSEKLLGAILEESR